MPSKGTPITCLRIPPDLLDQIDQAIARAADHLPDEPYTRTSWIISAIKEKLRHQERGRKRARRRRDGTPTDQSPAGQAEAGRPG